MTDTTKTKSNKGQFHRGQSGNPSGRPKTESAEVRSLLQSHSKDLASKAVELALEGNIQALKICLERITPPLKAQAATTQIDLPESASLADTARHLLQAVSTGQIAPDTAAQLIGAVESIGRIIELDELAKRLENVEALLKNKAS